MKKVKYIESESIELKSKISDSLQKDIVAFLNCSGGKIYVGVDDNGNVTGINNIDSTLKEIADIISTAILPNPSSSIRSHVLTMDNKNIIEIEISKGIKSLYYLKKYGLSPKGCLLRVGTTCREMEENEIEKRYKLNLHQNDYLVDTESYMNTLSFTTFKVYMTEKGFHIDDATFESNFKFRTSNGRYNYLAELMSDNNTIPFIVARFQGIDKATINEKTDYGSRCVLSTVERVLARMDSENIVYSDTSVRPRKDKKLMDDFSLKEAIINAFVHNDWSISQPAIYIYDDRVEIISYGGLPVGETIEDFYTGISHPRSDSLMRIFLNVDLVEHTGHGVPNIVKRYGKECFKITDNYILTTIPFDKEVMDNCKNVRLNVRLNDTQKQILKLLKENPKYTALDLSEKLNLTKKTIERNFKLLKENNIIQRGGSKRDGYWIVL